MNRLSLLRMFSLITIISFLSIVKSLAANVDPCDTIIINLPDVNFTLCDDGECVLVNEYPGFVQYEWSDGETGQAINICSDGTYSVTVTDVNGCTGVGIVEVEQYFNSPTTIEAEFCSGESVEVNGTVYDYPGTFTDTLSSNGGCDSILFINIFEKPLTVISISLSFCVGDSGYLEGIWYTYPGTYTQITNGSGIDCDTIVIINITQDPLNTSAVNLSMCPEDSVFFNDRWYFNFGIYTDTIASQTDGCDTIVTIHLFELGPYVFPEWSVSICYNDTLPCFDHFCWESGTYIDTIAGQGDDCDTILALILTVDMPTPSSFTITPDAGTSSGSIELLDSSGYTYQWSTGATGPVISSLQSGEYTVTITSVEGCENIITYTVPGPFSDLDDIVSNDKFEVYPNPFLSDFSLTIPDEDLKPDTRLVIINSLGQMVHTSKVNRGQIVQIGFGFQPGLYVVFLINREEVLASARVIKTD